MDLPQATFRFHAEGVSLDDVALERISQYLGALAELLGNKQKVHLSAVTTGSIVVIARVEAPAVGRVRERLVEAKQGEPGTARVAWRRLDDLLAEDGAEGSLDEEREGGLTIAFPGTQNRTAELPAFWQRGELRGQLVRLHGEDESKHGRLRSGLETLAFECTAALALEMRHHLWEHVRVTGQGRWRRGGDGTWELVDFRADSFDVLHNEDIETVVSRLRAAQGFGIRTEDAVVLAELRKD